MQEISEKDGGLCADVGRSDDDACALVPEGGHSPLSGSGERDAHSEGLLEELDLAALNPRLRARFERLAEEDLRMTREQKDELAKIVTRGSVLFDEPLSAHSAIRVGGPAEAFAIAADAEELKDVIGWACEWNIDYRFFGTGSRTVVRDGGMRGLVIKLGEQFNSAAVDRTSGEDVYVSAGATMKSADFALFCKDENLCGWEKFEGLSGTLAGSLVLNSGCAAHAIRDCIEEMTIVDRDRRELTLKRSGIRFDEKGVRLPRTVALIRILFKLAKNNNADADAKVDDAAPVSNVMQIGPVFAADGKTPAEVLIDEAGLMGVRVGRARVSSANANYIINEGNAAARDIVVLMNLIREKVKEQSGTQLETVIEVVGEK